MEPFHFNVNSNIFFLAHGQDHVTEYGVQGADKKRCREMSGYGTGEIETYRKPASVTSTND